MSLKLGANSSHPMRLRGWRETISAPTKTNITEKPFEATWLAQTTNESALTARGNAETLSKRGTAALNANQAQASQAAFGLIMGICSQRGRRQTKSGGPCYKTGRAPLRDRYGAGQRGCFRGGMILRQAAGGFG